MAGITVVFAFRVVELQAKLKPLIQLFASPTSNEMRAMVYCVLRGMEIKTLEFPYQFKDSVRLDIVLQQGLDGVEHRFHSEVAWDAEILRHIGIMTLAQKPILHGFYASS